MTIKTGLIVDEKGTNVPGQDFVGRNLVDHDLRLRLQFLEQTPQLWVIEHARRLFLQLLGNS